MAALAAYKARGGRLGASLPQCQNLTQEARMKGAKAAADSHRKSALEAYADIVQAVRIWHSEGKSLRDIASILSADGQTTRRGKQWNATQVKRLLSVHFA
jgi:Recombinase